MRLMMLAMNNTVMPYAVFPLGAAVMSKAIEDAGHTVRLVDILSELSEKSLYIKMSPKAALPDEISSLLQKHIKEFSPECIGISLRNLESVDSFTSEETWSLARLRNIVSLIRSSCANYYPDKNIPIIMGGPGFSLLPEEIIDFIGADAGVIGAGEIVFTEALDNFSRGVPFPRLMHGAASKDNEIPGAHYGELAASYKHMGGLVGVQSRRGCSYSCSYCCYPMLEGKIVIPRPVEQVLAEIRFLHDKHGITEFSFADAVFNDPTGHWRNLAKAMKKATLPTRWTGFLQPRGLDKEDFKLLHESGAMALEFGTDAASDDTLRGLNKPFSMSSVIEMQRICAEEGIAAAHYIIFGGPGETQKTVAEGLENIESLENSVVLACSGLSLHKGTALHKLALAEGSIAPDANFIQPQYYFSPKVNRAEMEDSINKNFKKRRDRIFPPSAMDKKMEVLRRMGMQGILWDTLLPSKTVSPADTKN